MARARGVALALVLVAGCDGESREARFSESELALLFSLSPLEPPPASEGNDVADDLRAARLGRDLFFDTGLSAGGGIACASCHASDRYFAGESKLASGLGRLQRHAPSLIGVASVPFVYWDGRKDSLWAQALAPLEAPREHGFTRVDVVRRVATRHAARYEEVFGELPDGLDAPRPSARPLPSDPDHPHHRAWLAMSRMERDAVDAVFVRTGKAIEAYLRRLAPGPSRFDRFVAAVRAGDPSGGGILSDAERRGLRAFIGSARCVLCHSGPRFTDDEFHNLGLPPVIGVSPSHRGRSQGIESLLADEFRCGGPHDARECSQLRFLDPDLPDLAGAFRTPSLRNVAMTAPYMHTGQLETLEDVIGFYRLLPGEPSVGRRDPTLRPLGRDVSTDDLVAFLGTLTGAPPPLEWIRPSGADDFAALTNDSPDRERPKDAPATSVTREGS